MSIKELEDYYRTMTDNYASKATDLRQTAQTYEANKDYDEAVKLYALSAENYEKARLCIDFVNELINHEALEATK